MSSDLVPMATAVLLAAVDCHVPIGALTAHVPIATPRFCRPDDHA